MWVITIDGMVRGVNIMFEDDDLDKAELLQSTGRFLEVNTVELAEMIYERRKHNKSETSESLNDGD